MAMHPPADQPASAADKPSNEGLRRPKAVDIEQLERRVHLAELRAREAEAELRFIEASEKRKVLRLEGRERPRGKRSKRAKRREAKAERGANAEG